MEEIIIQLAARAIEFYIIYIIYALYNEFKEPSVGKVYQAAV